MPYSIHGEDLGWHDRQLDQLHLDLVAAQGRRRAAERTLDAASIIESDSAFDRAQGAWEAAQSDVDAILTRINELEAEIAARRLREDGP